MPPLSFMFFVNRFLFSSVACSFGVAPYRKPKNQRQLAPLFANRRESKCNLTIVFAGAFCADSFGLAFGGKSLAPNGFHPKAP